MNPRGILVATKGDSKIYYFLDPIANTQKDGAIVGPDDSVELIDFGTYILTEPFISEYKHTDFHQFLWGRNTGEDFERWMRTFVYKTQPVDKNLLKDVKIETSISPKIKSKHYFDNRAMEFKSLNASNQMELMTGVAVNRMSGDAIRTVGKSNKNTDNITYDKFSIDEEHENG